jgi:hypothetical protein
MIVPDSLACPDEVQLIFDVQVHSFNVVSAKLQHAAGVNPDDCLEIGLVEGCERTDLGLFFSSLQKRLWITPAEDGDTEQWRSHDRRYHWDGVRKLHPQSAATVVWAAAIGSATLVGGDRQAAEILADEVDLFIDRDSNFSHYNRLLELCQVSLGDAPDYLVQLNHTQLVNDLEKRLDLKY